ncbi:MAG: Y4yA family PLP-dependent enzyme [Thermoleophilia bacterium]
MVPLDARLEDWQVVLCGTPDRLRDLVESHGSPLNLIAPGPMARNAAELADAASRAGVELGIFFARKANKALSFVDEARRLGLGVDLASEPELQQALERGVSGSRMVMTAAVKPRSLLELCVRSGVTVALDNPDELRALSSVATALGQQARAALRLTADLGPGRPPSRFGFAPEEALAIARGEPRAGIRFDGVHFHLDGYASADRVLAMSQALPLVDALRAAGHDATFLDIGGGIPMSYLEDGGQWQRFGAAAAGGNLTYDGHPIGPTYPYHQSPVRGQWLTDVLGAALAEGSGTVAGALRERRLQLRCEPGRALLDGCGMTVARVVHRKPRRDGDWLIGVEMNRTQCRSTSDDFLVDPLLLPTGEDAGEPIEGFLTGAYCIEAELLTWRRLRFPEGVGIGDLVVFPNTAGYLMHILESSSHQMPLARNLVIGPGGTAELDPVDGG